MLDKTTQRKIYEQVTGRTLRKSLLENFSAAGWSSEVDDQTEFSSVLFIDIAGFSNIVRRMDPAQVREYLEPFYRKVIASIIESGGRIDRIVGDGILAVYSKVFGFLDSNRAASDKCFETAAALVEDFFKSEHGCKAAIGMGKLLFCRTGLEQQYEELTVIGKPLTYAYRLEAIANVNQVLLREDSKLGDRIKKGNIGSPLLRKSIATYNLSGLGPVRVLRCFPAL